MCIYEIPSIKVLDDIYYKKIKKILNDELNEYNEK